MCKHRNDKNWEFILNEVASSTTDTQKTNHNNVYECKLEQRQFAARFISGNITDQAYWKLKDIFKN